MPASGSSVAEDQADQRGFAGAVGADEPDAIAAHDPQRQVCDERAVAEALLTPVELGDQLAGALAGIQAQS